MNILTPEQGNSGGYVEEASWTKEEYSYDYPRGLDLKPGSKLHSNLVAKVLQRARDSLSVMSRRHESWNKIDDILNVYIKTDSVEQKIKKKDDRKPISIVVPYSFATLETLLTYMVGAFFQDPIFQYEGAAPEDEIGATLLQLCVDYQIRRSGGQLALHTMFRDGLAYGIGPLVAGWKVVRGRRVVRQEETFKTRLAKLFNLGAPRKAVVPTIFYEGGDLINLDPYLILPDTNVPIHKVGQGEFFGWIDSDSFQSLLKEENQVDSSYFNVKYLGAMKERFTEFTIDPSKRGYAYGMNQRKQLGNVTNNKTIVNMYVDLIPNDWDLGNSTNPEKWLFRVADSEILVTAEPVNLVHDQYPVVVAAPDYDGYSVSPVSRIEMIYGMQEVLNFLFNSHMANVRRSVNNMFIVDPSLANMPDFENPAGGLLVRLRRAAWGRGVQNVIEQLKVNDITRNNISDAFSMMGMIQRTSGANDNAMGIMREGSERRSATEAQGALSATAGRMERLGKLFSAQAMQPLSYLLGFHTQQLMTKDTYVKVLGEWTQRLEIEYGSKVKVNPLDLLVEFDVIPRDGSLPTDTKGMLDFWNLALQTISKSPELLQQIDTARVFMHMARLSGAKDVQDFIRRQNEQAATPAAVQPNEEVAQQAQAGNLVPAPEAFNAMGAGQSLGMMQ